MWCSRTKCFRNVLSNLKLRLVGSEKIWDGGAALTPGFQTLRRKCNSEARAAVRRFPFGPLFTMLIARLKLRLSGGFALCTVKSVSCGA